MARLGIFTINEAITRNVKEWWWLQDNIITTDVIAESKENGVGIWQ